MLKQGSDKNYYPYEVGGLADLRISRELGPLPEIRGWSAINRTISLIQGLFALITMGGFILLGITLFGE
jgi:hypothetical protein